MKKSIAIVSIILMTILPALMGAAQAKAVQPQRSNRRALIRANGAMRQRKRCLITTGLSTPAPI